MAPKSREQRLFGAACLKVTLEQNATSASASTIFLDTLKDLSLVEAEVDAYLREHREEVERALVRGGAI